VFIIPGFKTTQLLRLLDLFTKCLRE